MFFHQLTAFLRPPDRKPFIETAKKYKADLPENKTYTLNQKEKLKSILKTISIYL